MNKKFKTTNSSITYKKLKKKSHGISFFHLTHLVSPHNQTVFTKTYTMAP